MKSIGKSIAGLLLFLALPLIAAPIHPSHGAHAMVVSVHPEASKAGVEILKSGGNAVDAAVAVGFALAVVYPQAGNLGGGGFMLVRNADGAEHFLDFREKAPAQATAGMYLDADGKVIPDASLVGYRASGVPGSVAGLVYAQKKWGALPLARVMQPAIRLARDGFVLAYEDTRDFKDSNLGKFAESRRIFQRNGRFYEPGDIFRQPELARTLQRIARNPDEFYHGAMAKELAASLQKGGGLITLDDLAKYEVKERQPIHGNYRGFEIISAPPPSSGGTALVESLNILEGLDLAKYGDHSAESVHLITEAFRRAFYDRADFMGDPDFNKVPVAQLIDKRYGVAWRDGLDPDKATPSASLKRPSVFSELDTFAEGNPCARAGLSTVGSWRNNALAGVLPGAKSQEPTAPCLLHEAEDTTHFSVVDAQGDAVAVTTTLNGIFGSYVTAEGLGFLLNNEMDDFSSKPGVPNSDGLIQGPANAIGAGKRPLSSMTPTIVLRPPLTSEKAGKLQLYLVLGSPGGARIITTVANILVGVIDFGLNIQQAVNAPRSHHQWLPDKLILEPGFSVDTVKLLQGMGYEISHESYWSDGECILVDSRTGERLGGSDGRNNGKALGY